MNHNFYRQGGDPMDMPRRLSLLLTLVLTVVLLTGSSYAIPAFSRQYGTSCTTCHIDFPKLNDFGKAFKDAGFKFPKGDEDFIKVPQVMLGAPAQKELWPHTVFPGTIPGLPPIGLRFNQFFQHTSGNANNYYTSSGVPGALQSPTIPTTDFQPGYFSIFTAGNFGSDIAFWVDDDLSVAGANANGSLGDAYLRFVNVSRFFKLPTDSLTVKVGQFELDLPFTQARSYDISPYDIYGQANIGANLVAPGVDNHVTLAGPGRGIEVSGGHHYGGYRYAIAVVDQNTSATGPTPQPNVPSATGIGFVSDSNFKDLYGRFAYRFNLERDPASRHDVQAAGATGPRDHTYLTLGSYYFYGRSVQRIQGETAVLTGREPFYRVGGDFDFNYRKFNLYGLFMYGHDNSLLLNSGSTGFVPGSSVTFNGGFLQADYLALPWLMAIMRYDRVQSTTDLLNPTGGNYFMPVGSSRNRFTPGVQFLIHANIKASFEYAVRPQQALTYDPATGKPLNEFRTNTATGALEFVY
jgi:hypothetical protein